MFGLFAGGTHILGVAERTLNRMGFYGSPMTEERGTPGFVPSVAEGREVREVDWSVELNRVLPGKRTMRIQNTFAMPDIFGALRPERLPKP